MCDQEKLLNIASCIFSNYGKRSQIEQIVFENEIESSSIETQVPIYHLYTQHTMSNSLRREILALHDQGKRTSCIFRCLVSGLFPDMDFLAKNNSKTLNYLPIMNACKGKKLY